MSKKSAVILLVVSIIDLGILIGCFLWDIKEKTESDDQNEGYHDYGSAGKKEDEHVR